MLNRKFEALLGSLVLKPPHHRRLQEILGGTIKSATQRRPDETLKVSQRIDSLIKRINAAKELLLQGDLTGADYRIIKSQCEAKISLMGSKIEDFQVSKTATEQDGSEAYRAIEHLDAF